MKTIFAILMLCSFSLIAAPVNVNQADAETLSKALKGIGPKKAEAIVQYRKEHGEFKSLKDLENVKGIGGKTLKANEQDILFSEAGAPIEEKAKEEKPGEPGKSDPVKKSE